MYQEDTFKIYSISEKYNDIFKIDYDKELKSITVKRIDSLAGWGQDLKLKYIETCGNIKIIDFGLAKISDTDIDEDTGTFLNFIDNFFFN